MRWFLATKFFRCVAKRNFRGDLPSSLLIFSAENFAFNLWNKEDWNVISGRLRWNVRGFSGKSFVTVMFVFPINRGRGCAVGWRVLLLNFGIGFRPFSMFSCQQSLIAAGMSFDWEPLAMLANRSFLAPDRPFVSNSNRIIATFPRPPSSPNFTCFPATYVGLYNLFSTSKLVRSLKKFTL